MSKNRKKAQALKAQQKADRTVRIIFIALVVLALIMLIGFSFV